MAFNPIDRAAGEERDLFALITASLHLARGLPVADIEAAIRDGSDGRGDPTPLFKTPAWRDFLGALRRGLDGDGRPLPKDAEADPEAPPVSGYLDEAAQKGARWSVETLSAGGPSGASSPMATPRKPILLDPEIAELGGNWARYHAGQLIRGLDAKSRANIRRLVRNASRRLARNPRSVVIEQLAREIRDYIGLSSRGAGAIQRWERLARKDGTFTEAARDAKIAGALERRAMDIARAEIAVAFNEGTMRAARLAEKKGTIPQRSPIPLAVVKQAMTQEDGRQRETHQEVSDSGPIPLDDLFPRFNTDRPPWPGEYG